MLLRLENRQNSGAYRKERNLTKDGSEKDKGQEMGSCGPLITTVEDTVGIKWCCICKAIAEDHRVELTELSEVL